MTVTSSLRSYAVDRVGLDTVREALEGTWIVTDENVARLYEPLVAAGRSCHVVPSGEKSKSIERFQDCHSWLARTGAQRNSTLVALGGGVVGDLAGFVAATYMRGISLLMVPTSLLAMVDSSVGGKVAVNIPEGKNLVGAFYPPTRVLLADEFLRTLPPRERLCGMAEVWKTAAILDSQLFADLEKANISLSDAVMKCVGHKAAVVQEDEHETTGRRAVLNFGHTVGHAVEACTGYGSMTHGEAVSIGMVFESILGEQLGVTEPGTSDRIRSALESQGLPTGLCKGAEPASLLPWMRRDKKATDSGLAFSLLTHIGECKLVGSVPEEDVLRALETA